MAKNETTADPLFEALEEAEWTSTSGRQAQASPYLGVIQHALDTGKTFALTVTLNGRNTQDRVKELGKHVLAFRKAGGQTEPACSVLVQAGEIDEKTGDVKITFRTRDRITRTRKTVEGSSVESSSS